MKKTIKYGGLVAGVATAAAAMGGTPVFAAAPESQTYDDCSLRVKATSNVTLDESDYASVAEYKYAQADEQAAIAYCFMGKAKTTLKDASTDITAAGLEALTDEAIEADEFALPEIKKAAEEFSEEASKIVADYGVVSEDTLKARLGKGSSATSTPWYMATQSLAEAELPVTDAVVMAAIESNADDGNSWNAKDTLDAYYIAEAASKVVTAMSKVNASADKATAAAEKTALYLEESFATSAVKNAQEASDNLDEKVEDAQELIDELPAGHTKTALQAALDAVKDGNVTEDDAEKVESAAKDADTDKAAADEDLTTATDNADTAKSNAGLSALDYAPAKAAAKSIADAYLASDDALVSGLDKKTLIKDLKSEDEKSLWMVARAECIDDGNADPTDEDILDEILTSANYYENNKKFEGVKDLVAAYKAQAVVDAVDAYDAANDAVAKAKAAVEAADAVKDAMAAAESAEFATEMAKGLIDTLKEDNPSLAQELADALNEATDNKGEDDNKGDEDNTKTYTYETLSDSETAYVAGNALVLHFDAPFEDFDYLTIDGVTIDASMYTVEEGSTKITLSSALLDTLKSGEHTVIAYYADGKTATAKFTIASAEVATPNTGAYTTEAASATSSVSAVVSVIMAATLAGAVVVLRKRSA